MNFKDKFNIKRKNSEVSQLTMRVTKKSIKFIDRVSRSMIGSFDSSVQMGLGKEKTEKEKEELRKEYNKQYQIKRQSKLCDIAECNDFYTMITLTFSPDDNQTEEQVKYNWKKAKQRLEYAHGKFAYICSLERGEETGHLHFHIITNINYINNHSKFWNDTNKINKNYNEDLILELINKTSNRSQELKNKRIELFNEGASYLKVLLGFGHVHVKKIESEEVKYITKYATKDKDLNTKYKRTVWTSRGLELPVRLHNQEAIDWCLENMPCLDYDYKQTVILQKVDNEILEVGNTYTLTFNESIKDFYYICKKAAFVQELRLNKTVAYNKYIMEKYYQDFWQDKMKILDLKKGLYNQYKYKEKKIKYGG